jgi:HEPN domain-containing protein
VKVVTESEHDDRAWLTRLDAGGWVRAALLEVGKAAGSQDPRAIVAGCKRAAGMALNGYLILEFEPSWGRSYVEHLRAASADTRLPEAVRVRAKHIVEAEPPQATLVQIRTRRATEELVEATKDVIAWVYAEVVASEARDSQR